MLHKLYKALSFYFADLIGLLVGIVLLFLFSDTEVFYIIISPRFYLIVLLCLFLVHSWAWLLAFHGENAYLKVMLINVLRDFFLLTFGTLFTIGAYFLVRSFL